jgi:hypothetical protein
MRVPQKKRPGFLRASLSTFDVGVGRLPASTTAATASASAAIAAKSTAARTTAAASTRLVLCFVDSQWTTVHRIAVQALNRSSCIRLTHLDETESAWTAGFSIRRQRNRLDCAMLREQRSHLGFTGRKRQVTHINLRHKKYALQNNPDRLRSYYSAGRTNEVRESASHEPSKRRSCHHDRNSREGFNDHYQFITSI